MNTDQLKQYIDILDKKHDARFDSLEAALQIIMSYVVEISNGNNPNVAALLQKKLNDTRISDYTAMIDEYNEMMLSQKRTMKKDRKKMYDEFFKNKGK